MVFPSVPLYPDPPNWQQHEVLQANPHQQLPSQESARARMAVAEGPLNCPRCDSTNTKFCYFNNYSLAQPRHFCKACRRYWTRGGALRSVPVGGGCRRNKRPKRARSPRPPPVDQHLPVPISTTTTTSSPFSFMASLQNMTASMGLGYQYGALQALPPHHHHQQQQPSLFGVGLTEASNAALMYPPTFQMNGGGGVEKGSFGKAVGVKLEGVRGRATQLRGGPENNMPHFWSTTFNNSLAGSANGGLWN